MGTEVRVVGFNFDPFEDVNITFDGQYLLLAKAGASGFFEVIFLVPDVSPGDYQVVVGNTGPRPFVVTPTVHACFTNHKTDSEKQGQLRIVSGPAYCHQNETPISWNK